MTFDPKKHSHDLLLLHHLSTTASETTLIRQPNLEKCNELLKLSVPGASICIEEVMKDAREIFYRIAVSHLRFLSSIPSPISPLSKLEYGLTTAHNPFGEAGRQAPGCVPLRAAWLSGLQGYSAYRHQRLGILSPVLLWPNSLRWKLREIKFSMLKSVRMGPSISRNRLICAFKRPFESLAFRAKKAKSKLVASSEWISHYWRQPSMTTFKIIENHFYLWQAVILPILEVWWLQTSSHVQCNIGRCGCI